MTKESELFKNRAKSMPLDKIAKIGQMIVAVLIALSWCAGFAMAKFNIPF